MFCRNEKKDNISDNRGLQKGYCWCSGTKTITVRKGMNIKSLYDSLRDHKWLIALNKQK